MTYKEIENQLKSEGFTLDFGISPLRGMRFKNDNKYAFVFLSKENGEIKHQLEYVN